MPERCQRCEADLPPNAESCSQCHTPVAAIQSPPEQPVPAIGATMAAAPWVPGPDGELYPAEDVPMVQAPEPEPAPEAPAPTDLETSRSPYGPSGSAPSASSAAVGYGSPVPPPGYTAVRPAETDQLPPTAPVPLAAVQGSEQLADAPAVAQPLSPLPDISATSAPSAATAAPSAASALHAHVPEPSAPRGQSAQDDAAHNDAARNDAAQGQELYARYPHGTDPYGETPSAPAQSPVPSAASPAPSARSAGQPDLGYTVRLLFGDGSSVRVASDAALGRKPQLIAAEENLISVPVIDPLKSSSRVHLRMRLRAEGVSVEDAGSGNGTRVEHEGRLYDAQAGQPFWVVPGDTVWLGEVPVAIELG